MSNNVSETFQKTAIGYLLFLAVLTLGALIGHYKWFPFNIVQETIDFINYSGGKDDSVLEKLKNDFGNEFVFYSNIANTTILPHGTPDEVEQEVKEKISFSRMVEKLNEVVAFDKKCRGCEKLLETHRENEKGICTSCYTSNA